MSFALSDNKKFNFKGSKGTRRSLMIPYYGSASLTPSLNLLLVWDHKGTTSSLTSLSSLKRI